MRHTAFPVYYSIMLTINMSVGGGGGEGLWAGEREERVAMVGIL